MNNKNGGNIIMEGDAQDLINDSNADILDLENEDGFDMSIGSTNMPVMDFGLGLNF